MRVSRPLLMFMRAAVVVQLVLGIGFWLGHWPGLVNLHMAIGTLFVLALWGIGVVGFRGRGTAGLATLAIIWGLVIAWLGMAQRNIMPGDLHWIIRVVHLAIALASFPIAERLVRLSTPPTA